VGYRGYLWIIKSQNVIAATVQFRVRETQTHLDLAMSVLVSVFDHEIRADNVRNLETSTSNSTTGIEQYSDEWLLGFGSCLRPPRRNLNKRSDSILQFRPFMEKVSRQLTRLGIST
jgi:hypothetical protein